jgi:hypothetical protein
MLWFANATFAVLMSVVGICPSFGMRVGNDATLIVATPPSVVRFPVKSPMLRTTITSVSIAAIFGTTGHIVQIF